MIFHGVPAPLLAPLKTNPGVGAWRRIPWINLRGFWLEQAEFEIGAP